MADSTVNALTADHTPGPDSIVYTVDAPGGTPADRKTQVGSMYIRYAQLEPFGWKDGVSCSTGDGKGYLHIPANLGGYNLVECHAEVKTAGTTGTMNIQIYNVTDSQDMLSTALSIDTGETGSDTAASAYVINTSYDDVAENDVLRIDVDDIQTGTAAVGLLVTLGFRYPST